MSNARRVRRRALRVGACALLLAASGAALAVYAWFSEPRDDLSLSTALANLREVDPGKFYRSGQLTPVQLREAVETLGIRTLINLRGHDTSQTWYREEAAVAGELGVPLYNVHLSARSLPHPRELLRLLQLYRYGERPILVHCDGGADRAGEAAALYQIEYMGRSAREALEMLTLRFRHVRWLAPAKRYFIERYRGEDWARGEYDPCSPEFDYYDKARYCG